MDLETSTAELKKLRGRIDDLERQVSLLRGDLNAFLQSPPLRIATRAYRFGLRVLEIATARGLRRRAGRAIRDWRFKAQRVASHRGVSEIVDIVVPAFRGLDATQRCLVSVLRAKVAVPWELTVINDASPEPQLTAWLRDFAAEHRIRLIEHDKNLGFVASANEGFHLNHDRDVVLLNSDTEVFDGWLDGLAETARSDPAIGTVTPFSNNATICSYPIFCGEAEIDPDERAELARHTSRVEAEPVDLPTGVGFCFYIRRGCLRVVGDFDADLFGRGYGEENDFSLRAANLGWRNVLCPRVFVYHEGSVSFGAEKLTRTEQALSALSGRHPGYGSLVQDFIAKDPIYPIRRCITWSRIRENPKPSILFVCHDGTGGVPRHIGELRQLAEARGLRTFTLRGEAERLALVWDQAQAELGFYRLGEPPNLASIAALGLRRIHIHHTLHVPPRWIEALFDLGVPVYYTLHDFHAIYGEPKLTGPDHQFVEDPTERERLCVEKSQIADLARHQEQYRRWFAGCEKVLAPSEFVVAEFSKVYPSPAYVVQPHHDHALAAPYPNPKPRPLSDTEPLRVLVLGALGPEKGADILEQTAESTETSEVTYTLLGYAYRPLGPAVTVLGPYLEQDLHRRIRQLDPHVVWFPVRWPETYSYTLSAALECGLPIVAPRLGAFFERLHQRPATWLLRWDTTASGWVDFFRDLRARYRELSEQPWPQQSPDRYYEEAYFAGLTDDVVE